MAKIWVGNKIHGNLSLTLPRENLRPILATKSPQFKADIKPVEELYKPLRVASETSLKNILKQSITGHEKKNECEEGNWMIFYFYSKLF